MTVLNPPDRILACFAVDTGRFFLLAGAVFILAAVLRSSRGGRNYPTLHEIRSSISTITISSLMGIGMLWGIENGRFPALLKNGSLAYDVLCIAGLLMWHDAWFYWTHRALHSRILFEPVHRAHHRSTSPTSFASYSFSVGEAIVNMAFIPIWLAIVPTSMVALQVFLAIMVLHGAVGHCGHEVRPSWWISHPLTRWMITTVHHDMHHSQRSYHNFGLYFTFWDKLMKTEHPEYLKHFRQCNGSSGLGVRQ